MLLNLDVNDVLSMFYDLTLAAINDFVPMIELRRKFPHWLDHNVRNLLKAKEMAQKQ